MIGLFDMERYGEIWRDMERYGEIWRDMDRYGMAPKLCTCVPQSLDNSNSPD